MSKSCCFRQSSVESAALLEGTESTELRRMRVVGVPDLQCMAADVFNSIWPRLKSQRTQIFKFVCIELCWVRYLVILGILLYLMVVVGKCVGKVIFFTFIWFFFCPQIFTICIEVLIGTCICDLCKCELIWDIVFEGDSHWLICLLVVLLNNSLIRLPIHYYCHGIEVPSEYKFQKEINITGYVPNGLY